ncbi:MAG: hypothetical protein FWD83_08455 [Promicromonosporaceae bacterium]|nr:hypothetical protein [Promicromonosporaceae bacterium]
MMTSTRLASRQRLSVTVALGAAFLVAACGGGDDERRHLLNVANSVVLGQTTLDEVITAVGRDYDERAEAFAFDGTDVIVYIWDKYGDPTRGLFSISVESGGDLVMSVGTSGLVPRDSARGVTDDSVLCTLIPGMSQQELLEALNFQPTWREPDTIAVGLLTARFDDDGGLFRLMTEREVFTWQNGSWTTPYRALSC